MWYHGGGVQECGFNSPGTPVSDLSNSTTKNVQPADVVALNGTYTARMLTAEFERLVTQHVKESADRGQSSVQLWLSWYTLIRLLCMSLVM